MISDTQNLKSLSLSECLLCAKFERISSYIVPGKNWKDNPKVFPATTINLDSSSSPPRVLCTGHLRKPE